jgi:ABC-2 type transport system ATP-binding protein
LIEAGAESGFLLKASGLKKTFQEGFLKRKTREALKGVDIAIKPGKITGFLGPNGAGKSTTIKIILNFLRPESGTVEFVTGQQSPQHRQHPDIGYLQELAGLFPFLTPRETLYLVARNKGLTWEESAREIQRLAEKLALTEHLDRRLKNLSKGTVQKVALAVAILGQPDLLIFDEPFTGLDPIVMHEIRNLIMELKQAGQTIFLSSHLLPEVERLCEEVILINEGQVVCHGEIEQLKTAWQVAKLIKENPAAGEKARLILGEEFRDKGFAHLAGSLEKLLQDEMISQNLKQVLVPDLEKLFLESVMGKSTETNGPVN